MADELNVGKLVAEIILESDTTAADRVINHIKEVNDAAKNNKVTLEVDVQHEEDLEYIRSVLEKIGITEKEADKVLSGAFANTSGLKTYRDSLDVLAAKIDAQRQKVEELQRTMNKEAKFKSDWEEIERATASIDKERIALQELEARFDKTYAAQDSWVVKQVKSFQKQEAATDATALKQEKLNKELSDKESKNNFSMAMRTITASMKTTDSVFPDIIDNLDTLRTNIELVKSAVTADSGGISKLASWGAGIVGVIGMVISMIGNYIQKMQEKEEEARKAAAEAAKELEENQENTADVTTRYIEVKTKLDNLNLSRSEEIELKKELKSLQGELVDMYGKEIGQIDLENLSLERNLELLRQKKVEEAKKYLNENDSEIRRAEKELDKSINVIISWEDQSTMDQILYGRNDIYSQIEKIFQKNGFIQTKVSGIVQQMGMLQTGDAQEVLQKMKDEIIVLRNETEKGSEEWKKYSQVIDELSNKSSELNTEAIKDDEAIIEKKKQAWEIIQNQGKSIEDESEKWEKQFDTINEGLSNFDNLKSAYEQLSSGEKMSMDSLVDLTEKYPALQKYIAETGDMTLQNGELLKQVARDEINRNLDKIKSNEDMLKNQGELTDEEKGYYQELEAAAQMYRNQLKELDELEPQAPDLSGLTSELQSLGSAWAQLEQGKALDFNTTLSLINQYPEFAKAIADGSVSLEDQESVIRQLWETKKQEAINSIELNKQEQQNVIDTTNITINEIKRRIEAYKALAESYTLGSAEWIDQQTNINSANDKLNEMRSSSAEAQKRIDAYNAQIQALKNLNIETYNGAAAVSNKNEALAEELAYMEHLKALGQLTAEEELSWLERINSTYSKNKDEQYDMELRLYNAKKAWQEEQERAIADALQNEYKYIGYNKSLDALSKQDELNWLLRIRDQYALNAEQAIELQIKIYEAEKALREEREQNIADALQREYTNMSNQKSLDRLTAQQELEWLERIQRTYELNAEQRIELEIKIHNLKKQLAEDERADLEQAYADAIDRLERNKELSNGISIDLEIRQLEEIGRRLKLTEEDARDLYHRIRDLKNEKDEENKDALNKLGDAVIESLKNKYEQQREFEEGLINQSIENWRKWEDETVEAIQGQIDALDKLEEAQEQENKRQQTELQLAYEKDDYNRKQLQKELNRLDKEEAERLLQKERKAQKEALQEQIDEVKKQSEAQQEALEKELDAIGENYDKLTSSFNLRAEAEKTIVSSSQQELVDLIHSYAPEYNLAGISLGESLYSGFESKYKAVKQMVSEIGGELRGYQNKLEETANAAADNFWKSRAEYEAQINAQSAPAKQDISLTVIFNEPVESPVQVQRRFAEVVDNLAAEIKK